MSEGNSWQDEVRQAVADRAYALNYEEGIQCRVMPSTPPEGEEGEEGQEQQGPRTMEVYLDLPHGGHPFGLTWMVTYTDRSVDGIAMELVAPTEEGGSLWQTHYATIDRFRTAAHGLPLFINGFFAGRDSVQTEATATDPQAD